MAKLWRCRICGDPYVGESPPSNCPFCGARSEHIAEAASVEANFDVPLNELDRKNIEHSLEIELNNAAFYFCAASKTPSQEGRLLFKALAKVEAEHASIWKKVLKLKALPERTEACHVADRDNLEDSHKREERAIGFYRAAAKASPNDRIRQIFEALVEVETDHLHLSEEMLSRL